MKKFLVLSLLGTLVALTFAPALWAGEIDILVEKLVEKGILTPVEAQIVRDETKQEVAKEIAQQKSYALPKWAQKFSLKGDFRLRYQYERKGKEAQSRSRGRIRYRLGIEAKIYDDLKVAAGLASGSDDPRSTNQSFENTFDTPDIRLDYAYVDYMPMDGLDIVAGKFKRKKFLWAPTDLLWDGDINPEGGSLSYQKSLNKETTAFLNTGVWMLEEINSNNTAVTADSSENNPDPFLNYVQAGVQWKKDAVDLKAAGIYYGFHGVQGLDLPFSKDSNTKEAGSPGFLVYDYDSFGFSGEAGIKKPLGLPLQRVAVFGDFVKAVDPDEGDIGWAAGLKFGDKKVSKKGQWQGKYVYAWLEKDAFLDTFPDSDRLGGSTNVKSHEAAFNYAIRKNVILGLDYYYSDKIKGASDSTFEHLVQSDLVIKF